MAATETRWRVPLADVLVDDELTDAVLEATRSGWWSMGPRVAAFEAEFASLCGAEHAIAIANGTAALHLGLLAVGCGPGDEVVVPSLNFVAAANTIVHAGARPVFCDIHGGEDLNLDPRDLEAAIGPKTKAVVTLHYGGYPYDVEAVTEIAKRRGVAVVEDAAHAPAASWHGRMCGTFGDVGCFSFFSNKNMPVGEGGMLVTDNDELADRVRLLRSHGMTTLTWDRHRGHASTYDVVTPGFNYRLDEVRAAVGQVQLRRLPEENANRARIVARYREALAGEHGLTVAFGAHDEGVVPAHHLAVVLLPEGSDRDAIRAQLAAEGVQTSVHYPPIHLFSAYRDVPQRPLPRTDAVASRLLTLPLFGHMTSEQVEIVVDALLAAV